MIFKLWSDQQGWWPTLFLANQHMVGISSNRQLVYSFAVSIWHKMGSWKIPGMEWACQFSKHPFPKGGAVSALMLTMYTACSWKMWGLRSRWWRWQTVVIFQAWLIFWFSFWFTVWVRLMNELVERWYTSVKMGKEPQTISREDNGKSCKQALAVSQMHESNTYSSIHCGNRGARNVGWSSHPWIPSKLAFAGNKARTSAENPLMNLTVLLNDSWLKVFNDLNQQKKIKKNWKEENT